MKNYFRKKAPMQRNVAVKKFFLVEKKFFFENKYISVRSKNLFKKILLSEKGDYRCIVANKK